MLSGSYSPLFVKIPIPQKTRGTRILDIPTISDRIAQAVAKEVLKLKLKDEIFQHEFKVYASHLKLKFK